MRRLVLLIFALSFILSLNAKIFDKKDYMCFTFFDKQFCEKYGINEEYLMKLKKEPMYKFSPEDVNVYLRYCQEYIPNVRDRVAHIATKFLGQPYRIYLLGEFPFEIYDPDPIYCLDHSDCVTFVEMVYSMAFSKNWTTFITLLQRIRYKDGEISYITRNHWSLPDWDRNNSWLVLDISSPQYMPAELLGKVKMHIDKAKYFKRFSTKRGFLIGQEFKPFDYETYYVPYQNIPKVLKYLQTGDLVNIIRGFDGPEWCGHFGLIIKERDGVIYFLHSTYGGVRIQPLLDYVTASIERNERLKKHNALYEKYKDEIKKLEKYLKTHKYNIFAKWKYDKIKKYKRRKPYFWGIKFLRLREDALENLKKIDGADAPKVTAPKGLLYKDDVYIKEKK